MTMREGMAERENAAGADPAAGAGIASGLAVRLAICAAFVGIAGLYALLRGGEFAVMIALAAGFGAYMALNIGANDVANNVGPAVGARVLTLGTALVIAAIFEAAGAIIAGGDVVATIRGGIIDPELVPDVQSFVWLMMAALLAAAIWLNAATALGAPVSTTHSIVGGVLGGGIAAAGPAIVNWPVMGSIAASWVVSPVLGAGISAMLLYIVNRTMLQQSDIHAAGCRVVPLLVGAMAWAFATYLMLKGLHRLVPVTPGAAGGVGLVAGLLVWLLMRATVRRRIALERPGAAAINRLLAVPLVFAAALLSFAHGSNDVANAIGPLAAIVDVLGAPEGDIAAAAPIPFWVILLGAIGIVIGLALFGPRIIRTVGSELTKLDPTRAYCILMAAALTVILASQLGLPVSTTHVTVGAVLGVGFLREYLKASYERTLDEIRAHHPPDDQAAIDAFIARFTAAPIAERGPMLKELKRRFREDRGSAFLAKKERKRLQKAHAQVLVKRGLVIRIIAAWLTTVPATALIAAFLFFALRGMLLP
jgi:inorganic phosphate transporter, PiT family